MSVMQHYDHQHQSSSSAESCFPSSDINNYRWQHSHLDSASLHHQHGYPLPTPPYEGAWSSSYVPPSTLRDFQIRSERSSPLDERDELYCPAPLYDTPIPYPSPNLSPVFGASSSPELHDARPQHHHISPPQFFAPTLSGPYPEWGVPYHPSHASTQYYSAGDLPPSPPFIASPTFDARRPSQFSSSRCLPPTRPPSPITTSPCKPFAAKLAFLLRNFDLYGDVVSWDTTGTCFILSPCARLATEVLPTVFSHSSIAAFTRQLSTYGFHHLSSTQVLKTFSQEHISQPLKDLSAWSHPHFLRDDSSSLHLLAPRPSRARTQLKLDKADALVKAALQDRDLSGKAGALKKIHRGETGSK